MQKLAPDENHSHALTCDADAGQVLFTACIDVHLRDLGAVPVTSASSFTAFRPALKYSLDALAEANSLRVILLGHEYGPPWQETCRVVDDDDAALVRNLPPSTLNLPKLRWDF